MGRRVPSSGGGGGGVLAHLRGARAAGPEFRGVTERFGFGAGQRHAPSFVGAGAERLFWAMKSIFASRC